MNIYLNGKQVEFAGGTVTDLVEAYNLKKNEIVVEKNSMIVHKEDYGSEYIREGDVLEIVSFVGGG